MQKTRLESNVNENIIQEEIQILTKMLLKATQKLISEETFQKIVELNNEIKPLVKSINSEKENIEKNISEIELERDIALANVLLSIAAAY